MKNSKLKHNNSVKKEAHALFKVHRKIDIHKLPLKTALEIFDTIITPILPYNSEIWGAYEKNDLNKWDNSLTENFQLRFCKLYLGANRKASNIACRGELEKLPLLITIKKNIINYIKHIPALPDDSILKQCLNISKKLHKNRDVLRKHDKHFKGFLP